MLAWSNRYNKEEYMLLYNCITELSRYLFGSSLTQKPHAARLERAHLSRGLLQQNQHTHQRRNGHQARCQAAKLRVQ